MSKHSLHRFGRMTLRGDRARQRASLRRAWSGPGPDGAAVRLEAYLHPAPLCLRGTSIGFLSGSVVVSLPRDYAPKAESRSEKLTRLFGRLYRLADYWDGEDEE